jgi:hypothetical protein
MGFLFSPIDYLSRCFIRTKRPVGLFTIPMSAENKLKELEKIKKIAKINGYSEEFVDRIHKKHLKKDNLRQLTTLAPLTKNEDIPRAAITYYPAIANQLQNIFKKHKIMLVHSNKGKISNILGNSKDKSEQLEKSGIVMDGTQYTLVKQDAVFRSDLVNTSVISD